MLLERSIYAEQRAEEEQDRAGEGSDGEAAIDTRVF